MKIPSLLIPFLCLTLGSCITVSQEARTPAALPFVTSTLPPTRPGMPLPAEASATYAPDPAASASAAAPGVVSQPAPGTCADSAVMIADVTVPDNTQLPRAQKFTKTWRFLNNGKCTWTGYQIAFVAGDRLASPDTAPVPETAAGQTVDVSVELTAPSIDGSYTGFYELRKANGETLPIGIESTFWVKILIGDAPPVAVQTLPFTPVTGLPTVDVRGPASCQYSTSSSYQAEIANLINGARAQAGLPPLTINSALTAAAQGHSIDMACHGLISHTGSDGSSVHERIAAAGYFASRSSEIIYGSGYPQTAFQWWMNDTIHRNEILNPDVSEMGVGYAYVADTSYGGYYTVDFARP